jgi:hypothetical protein
MKLTSGLKKTLLAAVALLCLSAANGWARPPRARELCGVVQSIDPQTRTLTIQSPRRDEPLAAVWKRDTTFLRNWKSAGSAALKQGQRACVYYHSPFFGKPFVTKVVWADQN